MMGNLTTFFKVVKFESQNEFAPVPQTFSHGMTLFVMPEYKNCHTM